MPFTFKLSQRLARMWERAPVLTAFVLPQLHPHLVDFRHLVAGTCLAIFVALCRRMAFKCLSLESGERRHCRHVTLPRGRRMRDRHPCGCCRVPGTRWVVRVALLPVHKVV